MRAGLLGALLAGCGEGRGHGGAWAAGELSATKPGPRVEESPRTLIVAVLQQCTREGW